MEGIRGRRRWFMLCPPSSLQPSHACPMWSETIFPGTERDCCVEGRYKKNPWFIYRHITGSSLCVLLKRALTVGSVQSVSVLHKLQVHLCRSVVMNLAICSIMLSGYITKTSVSIMFFVPLGFLDTLQRPSLHSLYNQTDQHDIIISVP